MKNDVQFDRYLKGELDPPSTRSLAQAALDNEDLFDALVAHGAIETALEDPSFRLPAPAARRSNRWIIAIAGALAAAAGLLMFFLLRPAVPLSHAPSAVVAKAPAILLTAELRLPVSAKSPIFRGDEAASRTPKSEGKIVSIEDGVATVDLGSLDGMQKGQQIGGIRITTAFRDRSRGTLLDPSLRVNHAVAVPGEIHLSAVVEEVNALAASGRVTAARDLARNSLSAGSPGLSRTLLERLAALDYLAGAPDAAREHYEVAVNNFDQPPAASPGERASTLASYSALLLMSGEAARAGDLLQKSLPLATDPALRGEILGNLGAVAEIRLDPVKASGYYRQALATAADSDRPTIQSAVARLNKYQHP